MSQVLLRASRLYKRFAVSRGLFIRRRLGEVAAVDDVSFEVLEGETLGLVGGSGSGKSTLGRMILGLIKPDGGEVWFDDTELTRLSANRLRALRRHMQIVFQDPLTSLNPRRTVAENIARPLLNFGTSRGAARSRTEELLEWVGLDPGQAERYPHEFSGGQCQRIAIARALALKPRFVFLDEPVSALDVSVQAQILNLLRRLQVKLKLTYLFVSHNLSLVDHFADRTLVMHRGRIVEAGPSRLVHRNPAHPFTQNFLQMALHHADNRNWERAALLVEDLEDPDWARQGADDGAGCLYATICPQVFAPCRHHRPELWAVEHQHLAACHLFDPKEEETR